MPIQYDRVTSFQQFLTIVSDFYFIFIGRADKWGGVLDLNNLWTVRIVSNMKQLWVSSRNKPAISLLEMGEMNVKSLQ